MDITVTIAIVIIWSSIWTVGYSSPNPLNGQHLRVIWPRWSGNPKGLAGPLKGGVILEYLATRFNFTYEMIRVTESRFEPPKNGRGLFSYLFDQECDLLLHDVAQTPERHQIIDMAVPWIYRGFGILISVEDDTANVQAVIKPFQWPVWLGLVISTVCVIVVLKLLQRYLNHRSSLVTPENTGNQYLYVFGNLLSQGFPCTSNRLSFRLVAGVWSLAAFIFVQAYTSTLFTYVVTPINRPLVNSVYDILENKHINVLVRKGGFTDIFFSDINNTELLYVKLRERVNSFPQSRCSHSSECIKLLFPGSKNAFIDASAYQLDAIREDFKKTGRCNLQMAREGFAFAMISFALPKNSPYTNTISKGMLELMQTGLIDYWDLWFRPMPLQCLDNIKSVYKPQNSKTLKEKNRPPALTLKNLTGAFIVLTLGFGLSFLAFLCEQIISIPIRHSRQSQKSRRNTANTQNQRELIVNMETSQHQK